MQEASRILKALICWRFFDASAKQANTSKRGHSKYQFAAFSVTLFSLQAKRHHTEWRGRKHMPQWRQLRQPMDRSFFQTKLLSARRTRSRTKERSRSLTTTTSCSIQLLLPVLLTFTAMRCSVSWPLLLEPPLPRESRCWPVLMGIRAT